MAVLYATPFVSLVSFMTPSLTVPYRFQVQRLLVDIHTATYYTFAWTRTVLKHKTEKLNCKTRNSWAHVTLFAPKGAPIYADCDASFFSETKQQ